VQTLACDVRDRHDVERAIQRVVETCGRIDVLINNAGVIQTGPVEHMQVEDFEDAMAVHLWGPLYAMLAAVPHMRRQGGGRIVNISSRVGRQPDPYFAPYAAAKAALINFTKSLANAFSKDGVLANCVVPGLVRTEAVEEAAQKSAEATGKTVEEVFAETLRARPIPAGRMGEPEDVAGLVVFLASPRASWITGATFSVDGGILPVAP
jgi:NAD(P)-dependent dehydrogenase (short-subunit alcohol dehydrogenase family)